MTQNTQDTIDFRDYWRVIVARREIIIAVSLVIAVVAVVFTYLRPKQYMSSTVIAVKDQTPEVSPFGRTQTRYDPLYLRTQFEVIQSRPVLEEVIRQLDMSHALAQAYGWPGDEQDNFERTLKLLSRRMKVQQYRDTNLIEIQIYMDEPRDSAPQWAADAANRVAEVFREQSSRRSREARDRALAALHDSLKEQETKVEQIEKRVQQIREKYKLNIVYSASGVDSSLEKMRMTHLEASRVQMMMELEEKRQRVATLQALQPDKVVDVAPHMVQDASLVELVQQKRKAEVAYRELLQAQLGPKHPDVVSAQAVVDELGDKIKDAVTGLQLGLKADLDATKKKLEAIEHDIELLASSERVSYGEGYREYTRAEEDLEHARRVRNALEMKDVEERIEMRIPRTVIEIIEEAKPSNREDYVSPNFELNIVLGILLGILSGVGLAFMVEHLDTSVKSIEDIERRMDLPVLAMIPQKVKALSESDADKTHAEAYRVLRTNIQFSKRIRGGRTFCVTSGSMGEGKSLTLFNLAYVCAQFGDNVLVVDTDLHRPRQHKLFGVSNARGVCNLLVNDATLDELLVDTGVPNLTFLPSGKLPTAAHGLLSTVRMKELVAEVRNRYDLVLFDAPPAIGVSDTSLLAREMDGVVLVIQHRKHPIDLSVRAREMVENVGAVIVGVVLNNTDIHRDYSYYYHHYYSYPYAYTSDHKPAERSRA